MTILTKKQRRNSRFKLFSATIIILVVCFFMVKLGCATFGDFEGNSSISDDHVVGVFVLDNKTYTSSWSTKNIRTYWVNGTYISECSHGVTSAGITSNGSYIWVSIQSNDDIKKFTSLDCGGGEIVDLDDANSDTKGIHYYDGILYIVDGIDKKVYKYGAANESLISSFSLNVLNGNPYGITGDSINLYITDTTDKVIYKYLLNGTYVENSFSTIGDLSPYGIDINTTTFFNTVDFPNSLYRYKYSPPILLGMKVTLDSPSNDYSTNNDPLNFNATLTPTGVNITNSTLYVWWANTTLFQTNSTTYTLQNNSVSETFSISGWDNGNYLWNVKACYENETSGEFINCSWADSNYTLSWQPFEVTNENHNENVYETDNQKFNLSIDTLESVLQVSSILHYNGTAYPSSVSCSAGTCEIENEIDIPLVQTGESINRSFYWTVNVFDGSSQTSYNTSIYYQNTTRIHLEECGGSYTTQSLNFTAWNESNLGHITDFKFYGTFRYWLGLGTVKQSTSVDQDSIAGVIMCLSPITKTLQLDADIQYGFSNENITYVDRSYYFLNHSISDSSQDILLYLINAEDSTTFILNVEDQQTSAVPNALIYIQRYYPRDGIYRTVQIAKTDDNGKSNGFYVVETVDYRHIITLDGLNILTTGKGKILPESVPYTLNFRTGSAITYPWSYLEENPNIAIDLNFNETSEIITFSWIDLGGTVNLGRLLVYQQKNDENNLLICNNSIAFSSGTVTCNISGYDGSFIAYGYFNEDNTLGKIINFVIETGKDIFGNNGLIIGWLIILTATLAFIWNPTAMIIVHNVATIFVNLIGFISFGLVYIFSMIAISIVVIIFMKT